MSFSFPPLSHPTSASTDSCWAFYFGGGGERDLSRLDLNGQVSENLNPPHWVPEEGKTAMMIRVGRQMRPPVKLTIEQPNPSVGVHGQGWGSLGAKGPLSLNGHCRNLWQWNSGPGSSCYPASTKCKMLTLGAGVTKHAPTPLSFCFPGKAAFEEVTLDLFCCFLLFSLFGSSISPAPPGFRQALRESLYSATHPHRHTVLAPMPIHIIHSYVHLLWLPNFSTTGSLTGGKDLRLQRCAWVAQDQ